MFSEIYSIESLFSHFDIDKADSLSRLQAERALKICGIHIEEKANFFDGDRIDFQNFKLIVDAELIKKSDSDKASWLFDILSEGKEKIDVEDILRISKNFADPITENEARDMINCFDFDKDGKVGASDFEKILNYDE